MRLLMTLLFAHSLILFVTNSFSASPANNDDITVEYNLVYGEAAGEQLLLDVFMPINKTGKPLPALLFIHGGGWIGGSKDFYQPIATRYAKEGYVCFAVDYRLVKPGKNQFPAQLDDVQLAVRWVRSQAKKYNVDIKRIGAYGDSAGGHLVSFLGICETRNPEGSLNDFSSKVTCVVNVFGPTDLTADMPTSGPFNINVQQLVNDMLGQPADKAPEIARRASPLFLVDSNTVPFLIIHGTNDVLVPIEQSERFYKKLCETGIEAEYLPLPGAGHGFTPEEAELVFTTALRFYNRHLK